VRRVVLAALRKKRGYSLWNLAVFCRQQPGGEGITVPVLSAYLNGNRPIGDVHFRILCKMLRVDPRAVMVARFLVGRPRGDGK